MPEGGKPYGNTRRANKKSRRSANKANKKSRRSANKANKKSRRAANKSNKKAHRANLSDKNITTPRTRTPGSTKHKDVKD